jgi:hypothetical protein
MDRYCLYCSRPIVSGRSDKKFCDNAHNNAQKRPSVRCVDARVCKRVIESSGSNVIRTFLTIKPQYHCGNQKTERRLS